MSSTELHKMHKIIIIEDNEYLLENLLIYLNENGMRAIGTGNGKLGLQLVRAKIPDLIISDIKMPGIDGYEVLEALRNDPLTKKIPLIFFTGEQTDANRYRAMKLGANDYLDKCCGLEELLKAINAQLR